MRALALTTALLALAAGCRSGAPRPCHDDADCADSEVCFVDGCGDPGQGLAIEVTPSSNAGLAAEDFALQSLAASQDLTLNGPSALEGDLARSPDAGVATPYTSRVFFRVNGGSAIIPGLSRHFQTSLATLAGTYTLPVSSGIYTVLVEPEDPSVPPFVEQGVAVGAGSALRLDVRFPTEDALLRVTGTLLGDTQPITNAYLEVQAFSLNDRLPVSQKSPVSASGEFVLFVSPSVHDDAGLYIQAGPRDTNGVVPRKLFSVPDVEVLPSALRLGAYGNAVTASGTVVTTDGAPVRDATVYVEGLAAGGGNFSSGRVHTGANGRFEVQTLPPLPGASLVLVAVPPADASVGTARVPLSILGPNADVVCPLRLSVRGRLLRPEGTPVTSARVRAEAVGAAEAGDALPPGASGDTDVDGVFVLNLEPGRYRVDFQSVELPRMSRFVTVAGPETADLGDLVLSKGRRFTGTLSFAGDDPGRTVAYALVRVFRISTELDEPTAVLLDESYADANGRYAVLLPTR